MLGEESLAGFSIGGIEVLICIVRGSNGNGCGVYADDFVVWFECAHGAMRWLGFYDYGCSYR